MTITIWGARGSVPVPGPATVGYGGNTSCVSVDMGDQVLILDAGTGIRNLGASLVGTNKELYVLLSHTHSDHVQGFPFFGPLYEKGRVTHLLDYDIGGATWPLADRLDGHSFPLRPEQMPGHLHRVQGSALSFLRKRGFNIDRRRMHHPGGAYGYRLEHGGESFVFVPDNELSPPEADPQWWEQMVSFCAGAHVLLHDCQYLSDDMPMKWGWGHSTLDDVCRLAVDAGVRHLVLFHHDPNRSDEMLDQMEESGRKMLKKSGVLCTAAFEGMQVLLGSEPVMDAAPTVLNTAVDSGSNKQR